VTSASGSSDSPRRRGDSRTPDDLPGRLLGMRQWLSSITWGTFVIDFVVRLSLADDASPPIFNRVSLRVDPLNRSYSKRVHRNTRKAWGYGTLDPHNHWLNRAGQGCPARKPPPLRIAKLIGQNGDDRAPRVPEACGGTGSVSEIKMPSEQQASPALRPTNQLPIQPHTDQSQPARRN
jgi:hypothetical protein